MFAESRLILFHVVKILSQKFHLRIQLSSHIFQLKHMKKQPKRQKIQQFHNLLKKHYSQDKLIPKILLILPILDSSASIILRTDSCMSKTFTDEKRHTETEKETDVKNEISHHMDYTNEFHQDFASYLILSQPFLTSVGCWSITYNM